MRPLKQGAHFHLERDSLQHSHATPTMNPIQFVRMASSRQQTFAIHLGGGESREVKSHLVRVERGPIGRKDHDDMTNRIGDRAKVFLTLPQLLQ